MKIYNVQSPTFGMAYRLVGDRKDMVRKLNQLGAEEAANLNESIKAAKDSLADTKYVHLESFVLGEDLNWHNRLALSIPEITEKGQVVYREYTEDVEDDIATAVEKALVKENEYAKLDKLRQEQASYFVDEDIPAI